MRHLDWRLKMPGKNLIMQRIQAAILVMAVLISSLAFPVAAGAANQITEFPVPTEGSWPTGIAAAPDETLWFTEQGGNKIGRITFDGTVTEFPIPTANSWPVDIV